MNAEYDKGYQSGYDAGYKRAMLDYGLEDDKPCDDCVSRKAVLACEQHIWTDCGVVSVEDIKELPPVTPKQKIGHWEMPQQDDGMSDPIYYQVRCSECGFDLDPQTWHMELHQYGADKYCPHCGAKMEGESE